MSMRRAIVILVVFLNAPAWGHEDLVLPAVEFAATAVHESGAFRSTETIHYASGKLRIDRGSGFSSTILDLTTQTQCLLMANHTYLIMPMDDELFRRYIARIVDVNGARAKGTERIEGLETTRYVFGDDGALDAAGSYWLTKAGVMIRRQYEDGVFGHNMRHLDYLTHLSFAKQPAALFSIPVGYRRAE